MNFFRKAFLASAIFVASIVSPMAQTGVAPRITFFETDQTLPAGLWRIQLNGDVVTIDINTAAANNFTTATTAISIANNGDVTIPNDFFVTGSATVTVDTTVTGDLNIQGELQFGASQDAVLVREAADTLALKRSTNRQTFRIYATDDGAGNAAWMEIQGIDSGADHVKFDTTSSGSGTTRQVSFQFDGNQKFKYDNARMRLSFGLEFSAGNSFDIGTSGATLLPRTIYAGTSVVVGLGTTVGKLSLLHASTTLTMSSGSSQTASGLIPAGAIVYGVTTRVTTLVTGPAGYDVGDGADPDRWGNSILVAEDTTSDATDFTEAAPIQPQIFTAANDVVITTDGVDFTAGVIRVTVHYMLMTASTS